MNSPKCKKEKCEFFEDVLPISSGIVGWCTRGQYTPNGICWATIKEQRDLLYINLEKSTIKFKDLIDNSF